jgi:hypothetical protein
VAPEHNVDYVTTFVGSPDEMLAKIATDPGNVDITTTHVEAYLPPTTLGSSSRST